ncbi:hypothetical protein QBC39DRAFT_350649 [Podospora conica]|nr:hypothetical protein QBC39DRAFT_350649 [Schizothecium conicum]
MAVQPGDKMLSIIEVGSTPTADTPGSCIVVQFPNGRYLFGHVAEGTQRILTERNLHMTKMSNLFLSGPIDWQATGGLMGMVLTLADSFAAIQASADELNQDRMVKGKETVALPYNTIDIHGGRNLAHTVATTRPFIFRRGTPMRLHEIRAPHAGPVRNGSAPDWQDECLQVWYLPLPGTCKEQAKRDKEDADNQLLREHLASSMFNKNWRLDVLKHMRLSELPPSAREVFHRDHHNRIQKYEGPRTVEPGSDGDLHVLVREPWHTSFPTQLPPTQPSNESLCYLVKTHPRRGKFNPTAAEKFGVARQDYKLLTHGQDAVGANGAIISPDMVLGPTNPGHGWIVADIRYEHQVQAFLDRPEWADETLMQGIIATYWILSAEVSNDDRLVQWMKARPDMKHIMLGSAGAPNRIAFERQTKQIIQMNTVDPDRFPLPVYLDEAPPLAGDLATIAQVGQPKETVRMTDAANWLDTAQPFMNTAAVFLEAKQNQAVQDLAAIARQKMLDPVFLAQEAEAERDSPATDVTITTLGTGSSLPSKLRNVSANLLQIPFYGSFILDCGENTLGQIRRSFGYARADAILKDLRILYISHLHADHHLGAASILARRAKLVRENPEIPPLTVVACRTLIRWIQDYSSVEDLAIDSHIAFHHIIFPPRTSEQKPVAKRTGAENTPLLPDIDVCRVDHCHESMAVVLTWPTGLRVAYSGDCRPSDEFAAIGRGADLLIHECTFDSEMGHEAIAKCHSTMGEALEVGRKMEAKRILLTHFSQRYPKLPVFEDTNQTVLYAFDLMRVKLHDFRKAALFLPALQKLLDVAEPGEEEMAAAKEQSGRGGGGESTGDGKSTGAKKRRRDRKPDESETGEAPEEKQQKSLKYAENIFRKDVNKQETARELEELAKERREKLLAKFNAKEEERVRREAERMRKDAEKIRTAGLTYAQKKQRLEADTWSDVTQGGASDWWGESDMKASPMVAPVTVAPPRVVIPRASPPSTPVPVAVVKKRSGLLGLSSLWRMDFPEPKAKKVAGVKRSLSPASLAQGKSPSPSAKQSVETPSPNPESPTKAVLNAGVKA